MGKLCNLRAKRCIIGKYVIPLLDQTTSLALIIGTLYIDFEPYGTSNIVRGTALIKLQPVLSLYLMDTKYQ